MSLSVAHDKRKIEILLRAKEVFIEEGYYKTTYQKIADKCELTRTTLYVYYKNKQQIFQSCVKLMSLNIEKQFLPYMQDAEKKPSDKLKFLIQTVFSSFKDDQEFLSVILDYLLILKRSGSDPYSRVRRRTIRLRRYVTALINEGIKQGEFSATEAQKITDVVFAILEATILRVSIFDIENVDQSLASALEIIETLKQS